MRVFWIGLILAVITGCICDPQVVPSVPDPAITAQTTKQSNIVIKDVTSDFPTVTLTICDFCLKPIVAADKESLVKRMREYGWYLTLDNKVICAECANKRTKLKAGNYF